jgi:hypothetical protein
VALFLCLLAVRPPPGPLAGSTIELKRPEALAQQQQAARTDIAFTRPPAQVEDAVRQNLMKNWFCIWCCCWSQRFTQQYKQQQQRKQQQQQLRVSHSSVEKGQHGSTAGMR